MLQSRDLQTSNPVTTKIYKNGYGFSLLSFH